MENNYQLLAKIALKNLLSRKDKNIFGNPAYFEACLGNEGVPAGSETLRSLTLSIRFRIPHEITKRDAIFPNDFEFIVKNFSDHAFLGYEKAKWVVETWLEVLNKKIVGETSSQLQSYALTDKSDNTSDKTESNPNTVETRKDAIVDKDLGKKEEFFNKYHKILRLCNKPSRYIGGEVGSVIKDKSKIDVRFAFCFPDTYDIGMSHLGMKILYSLINERSDSYCERVFAPWVDMEEEMKKSFRPEFLNRIDDIIVFAHLSKPEIRQIVDLLFKDLFKRLESQDLQIEVSEEVKDYLAEDGYSEAYGARPLKRLIQKKVEDGLAEEILGGKYSAGKKILLTLEDKKIKFATVAADEKKEAETTAE